MTSHVQIPGPKHLASVYSQLDPEKMAPSTSLNLRKPRSVVHGRNKSSLAGLDELRSSSLSSKKQKTFRSASEGSRRKANKVENTSRAQNDLGTKRSLDAAGPTKNQSLLQIRSRVFKKGNTMSAVKNKLVHEIEKVSFQFLKSCEDNNKDVVLEYMTLFLNYCVDLNLIEELGVIIKYMAEFSQVFCLDSRALFYFDQLRRYGLYLNKYAYVVDSLVGISRCCSKIHMNEAAISFLRKALMYAWGIESRQKELKIYDEFGMKYYFLGNTDKAQYYHQRFTGGILQDDQSKLKVRIQAVITKQLSENKMFVTDKINVGLMLQLNLPIRTIAELASLGIGSIRVEVDSFRQQYYYQVDDCEFQIRRIFREREFSQNLPSPTYRDPNQIRKLFSQNAKTLHDTKLNLIIQRFQSRRMNRDGISSSMSRQSNLVERRAPKSRLDDNIRSILKAPPIDKNWEDNLINKFKSKLTFNAESNRAKSDLRVPFQLLNNIFKAFYEELLES